MKVSRGLPLKRFWIFALIAAAQLQAVAYASCHGGECLAQSVRELRLSSDREIDVRVMMGYDDCSPNDYVCNVNNAIFLRQSLEHMGFERTSPQGLGMFSGAPSSAHYFGYKAQTYPLEDGSTRTIRISFASAALTGSHAENVADADDQNQWSTTVLQKFWKGALEEADVALYLGHSRDGGGPDPFMPILDEEKHVKYSAYKKDRPGITFTAKTIKADDQGPEILGLLSCSSVPHFKEYVRGAYRGKSGARSYVGSTKVINNTEMLDGFTSIVKALQTGEVDKFISDETVYRVVGIGE